MKDSNNRDKVTVNKRALILSLVVVVSLSVFLMTSGPLSSSLILLPVKVTAQQQPSSQPQQPTSQPSSQPQEPSSSIGTVPSTSLSSSKSQSCQTKFDCAINFDCSNHQCVPITPEYCQSMNKDFCIFPTPEGGAKSCLDRFLADTNCNLCGGDTFCNKRDPGAGSRCGQDPQYPEQYTCQCPPERPYYRDGKCQENPCPIKNEVINPDTHKCECLKPFTLTSDNKCVFLCASQSNLQKDSAVSSTSSSSTLSSASSAEQCKNCPKGQTACNGQCVDPSTAFQSDPSNCGSCGNACPAPSGGTATCTNSQCGQQCPSGQEVFNNQCVPTCPEGQTRDPSTGQCQQPPPQQCPGGGYIGDYNNCGSCGNSCLGLTNSVCQQNQCVFCPSNLQANPATNTCECGQGLTYCEGGQSESRPDLKCDDLSTSKYNCGACGKHCLDVSQGGTAPLGSSCYSGVCGCGPDEHQETSFPICSSDGSVVTYCLKNNCHIEVNDAGLPWCSTVCT